MSENIVINPKVEAHNARLLVKIAMSAMRLFYSKDYSKLICQLNLYTKYIDGRCQWCGEVHGK